MDPRIFEIAISGEGVVAPGQGVLAAFVPAADNKHPVVLMCCDPRRDLGKTINVLAPMAIAWIDSQLGQAAAGACWTVIDNYGHFVEAAPKWQMLGEFKGLELPEVKFDRFIEGSSIEAFYKEIGPSGEVAVELLSTVLEAPSQSASVPSVLDFLHAVDTCSSLPAPSLISSKVSKAAAEDDYKQIAAAVQADPVISALLIQAANAARFAAMGKTASVPQAISRLGNNYVLRVVFIADMMARYQKGNCAEFNYNGYWQNALATGVVMTVLREEYKVPRSMADDAFTTGLVSGIGWLVVAETYPALMARYLRNIKNADPVTKIRNQRSIFPCEISTVAEHYLERLQFPESILSAVAGRVGENRQMYDLLARSIRIAQAIAPFDCLAIPTTLAVPEACLEEWNSWQSFLSVTPPSPKLSAQDNPILAPLAYDPQLPETHYMGWR